MNVVSPGGEWVETNSIAAIIMIVKNRNTSDDEE